MTTLVIDPEVYHDAGKMCSDLAAEVGKATDRLIRTLAGTHGMAGSYDSSKPWASSYEQEGLCVSRHHPQVR